MSYPSLWKLFYELIDQVYLEYSGISPALSYGTLLGVKKEAEVKSSNVIFGVNFVFIFKDFFSDVLGPQMQIGAANIQLG